MPKKNYKCCFCKWDYSEKTMELMRLSVGFFQACPKCGHIYFEDVKEEENE